MQLGRVIKVLTVIWLLGLPGRPVAASTHFDATIQRSIPELPELSGLAVSRQVEGGWWALNDSGNAAELIALDAELKPVRRVSLTGHANHDWEDLASFEQDGQGWLLVADSGNNFGFRAEQQLLLLAEPETGATRATVDRVIRFRFEDGPRDCEAIAVDAASSTVLLADKGRNPVGLYALPLDAGDGLHEARRIAEFPALVPGKPPLVQGLANLRGRGTPTAMDLSEDGRQLAVLTYLSLSLFERAPGQDWSEALRAPLRSQRLPRQGGFEAAAFARDAASVLLGAEGAPVRFLRWWPSPAGSN